MSTYATMPVMKGCSDPMCDAIMCNEDHSIKKPWYMTATPVPQGEPAADPVQLMKVGSWVLEKWTDTDPDSFVQHYCTSEMWKKHMDITEIREGFCKSCHENVPEEITGAWTLHNWKMLQKYDADMAQYGADPYSDATIPVEIEVFR